MKTTDTVTIPREAYEAYVHFAASIMALDLSGVLDEIMNPELDAQLDGLTTQIKQSRLFETAL